MTHDPLCSWANTPTHRDRAECPRCSLIARVRADERDRVHATIQAGEIPASLYAEMVHDAFADLRAKVEGLGLAWSDSGGFRWVRQADVLALLGGGSDD